MSSQRMPSHSDKNNVYPVVSNSDLLTKILSITRSLSRPYFRNALIKVASEHPLNATLICNFIETEQVESNIKDSTKEGKIKTLIWLSNFHGGKNFDLMTKDDLVNYLNSLRKPVEIDPSRKWIGSYNGRQAIFLKFFKWLHYSDEPDYRKRQIPNCLIGIKKLNRIEKTPYKSSDIWDSRDNAIFLKYCPSVRDRCFHSLAIDMSARPSEILNLRINDIRFCVTDDGKQYAEVRIIDGKTGPRTVPLVDSIPYLKEWILEHPYGHNPSSWLFISQSTSNKYSKFTYEGLSTKYEYYKKKYFPSLLFNNNIIDVDKSFIKNMLLKPWNLYILRHSALTEKSQYLPEAILRSHAGWSMSSKMPQIYLHLSGESSKILLQRKGILKKEDVEMSNMLKSKECPNCNEPNKPDSRFCGKCRMVLNYNAYAETLEEQKRKEDQIKNLEERYENGMKLMKEDIENRLQQIMAKIDISRV